MAELKYDISKVMKGFVETAIKQGLFVERWFPISEKLPEEDGCYLVTTTGTNNDIIDIAYYTDGNWHKASRIKAWMPLPTPYKAESEEVPDINNGNIYKCQCGYGWDKSKVVRHHFCPNCGAKVVEPTLAESEG